MICVVVWELVMHHDVDYDLHGILVNILFSCYYILFFEKLLNTTSFGRRF